MNYWLIVLAFIMVWNLISAAIVYISVLPKLRKFWFKIYIITWILMIPLIIRNVLV